MKRSLIVTDLTRFRTPGLLCTAGMDPEDGECIRPMPYLISARWKELNVLPGTILSGDFTSCPDRTSPHIEDFRYRDLANTGSATVAEFRSILEEGRFPPVEAGFGHRFPSRQKHVPFATKPDRSLITISVAPRQIAIIKHSSDPGRVQLNFTDGARHCFSQISVTDLGFHDLRS